MIVIGLALVGGALTVIVPPTLVPDTFKSLDQYVGTEGSVVGGVFGLGLIWAALNPAGHRIWVHLAMLYSLLLLVREGLAVMNGQPAKLAPIVFGLATIIILAQAHPEVGFHSNVPVPFGGPSAAFILAVFISFGYAIGWNPFASDYSRYLPRNSNPRSVALAAGLGVFVSCTVLEIAGAAAATIGQLGNNPTPLFTDPLPVWLSWTCLRCG